MKMALLLSPPLFMNATKYQWHHIRNLIFNPYICTLFIRIILDAHAVFLFQGTLLKMILIIRKSQKSTFYILLALVFNTVCFSDSSAVTPTAQEGGSPIPLNVDPTTYDFIMPEVDDILHTLLTPLLLPHAVPEPVCEMQTPALFTMA